MAYIKEYWQNKEQWAMTARNHTKEMQEKYGDCIRNAVSATKIYNDTSFKNGLKEPSSIETPTIIVEGIDSVGAIMKYGNPSTAVLNFSSYKNPGGLFLDGSKAQEESLCHESFLYNVLKEYQTDFYDWNNQHKNKALYLNRGLFSPGIWFFRKDKHAKCSVITCASPNKSSAQKYMNVSDEENSKVLRSRIKFVLDVAKDNNITTLILGAYGCGVFGQDATEVASIFKEYLLTTHTCFDKVVFAIPNSKDGNLEKFVKVFSWN